MKFPLFLAALAFFSLSFSQSNTEIHLFDLSTLTPKSTNISTSDFYSYEAPEIAISLSQSAETVPKSSGIKSFLSKHLLRMRNLYALIPTSKKMIW